ncbi:hypothetical protein Zmor_014466 [Zophobas morio]|uniref:Uncharacterized protein n=1 Tax=Zophobas morio TaxID=2755281 RepID=A0AA38IJT4_9CUCU|nr:hypothetical protein Zmor_014466 [Zophobas morio]
MIVYAKYRTGMFPLRQLGGQISTLVFATNKVLVLHTVDQEEAEEDQGTWTETSPAPVRPAGDPQDELQGPPQPITAQ